MQQRWHQTDQEIGKLLAEYDRQDQSVKAFCQMKKLPEWRFYSWKKKYGASLRVNNDQPGFVALQVRRDEPSEAVRAGELFAEVQAAQGSCIRIFQPVPPSYLQALLS